jgi:hypothetical protein
LQSISHPRGALLNRREGLTFREIVSARVEEGFTSIRGRFTGAGAAFARAAERFEPAGIAREGGKISLNVT